MEFKKAQREHVKLRIGISSPSGFGKTYSALLLAYGMTNDYSKIAIIDTENGSASLYSALGNFNTVQLEAPYSPEKYIKAIELCESAKMEVIIIDSISHEWSGTGGCLDIHEQLGGTFQNWAKVTPRHQAFVDKILQSKAHVISTTRRKVDYSMDKDASGKTKVFKHGTKEITREGFEYELTVNFEIINDNHLVNTSKDRTGLFMNKPEFTITPAVGKRLINWCASGIDIQQIKREIQLCKSVEELRALYSQHANLKDLILEDILKQKTMLEDTNAKIIPNISIVHKHKPQENGTDAETS